MSLTVTAQTAFKAIDRAADYWRGIKLWLKIKICGGKCIGIPRVGRGVTFRYPPHKGVSLGKNIDIGPFTIFETPPGARLQIGNNVKLTAGVYLSATISIEIGNDCLIAEWVSIRDGQHEFRASSTIRSQGLKADPVILESDVWIGRASAVFQGSHLESGCIVGAQSIVKKQHLLRNTINVGNPAVHIGDRE